MKMRHEKALDVGLARAEVAAEALRRWTGVRAIAVCAVQTVLETGLRAGESWEPVGPFSYKEIARDDGMTGGGNYHLLIVDENWTAKACTSQRFQLDDALQLADRLPIPVAAPGEGELWKALAERKDRADAAYRAKYPDV